MTNKGSNFERLVCRALSLWWSNTLRDDIFWRNRTKITTKTPHAERQLGDITITDSDGAPFIDLFSIECKAGYSLSKKKKTVNNVPWDLLDVIDGKKKKNLIYAFWEQCSSDAELSNKFPLLVFKRDYHKKVVCTNGYVLARLEEYAGKAPLTTDEEASSTCLILQDNTLDSPLYLYSFSFFFSWLTPEAVMSMWRAKYGN